MEITLQDEYADIQKAKIVLIDDNPSNLMLAGSILKKNDYEVFTAKSGDEGLDLITRIMPDLILLDIMMPNMDGYQVCNILKQNAKLANIPVIFLTALQQTEDLLKSFEIGGVDYITKPFKKEELFARVKTHIELKRSKDIILSQNHKLHKLNDEKNGLLHITAHDLKNPLQGIFGLVEILKESRELLDEAEYNDICNNISASIHHAVEIINDLLDSDAIEHGKFNFKIEKFSINELFEDISESFEHVALAKNIDLEFNLEENLVVNADYSKFKRAIENLISNALKFSSSNTKVKVHSASLNDQIYISIKDEGPGFSAEDKTKLFQKYSKLSARPTAGESSTGLGLSIVKSILENMEAKIELKSELGKGSEFIITCLKST